MLTTGRFCAQVERAIGVLASARDAAEQDTQFNRQRTPKRAVALLRRGVRTCERLAKEAGKA